MPDEHDVDGRLVAMITSSMEYITMAFLTSGQVVFTSSSYNERHFTKVHLQHINFSTKHHINTSNQHG